MTLLMLISLPTYEELMAGDYSDSFIDAVVRLAEQQAYEEYIND